MNSPLWLLGIACAFPQASMHVGMAIGAPSATPSALPVSAGAVQTLASLPVILGDRGIHMAMAAKVGSAGDGLHAFPVAVGVVYG